MAAAAILKIHVSGHYNSVAIARIYTKCGSETKTDRRTFKFLFSEKSNMAAGAILKFDLMALSR